MYCLARIGVRLFLGIVIALSGSPLVPASGRAVSSPRVLYVGVNLHPLQARYAVYPPARTLQLASEIGASVVRIDIHWEWFEYLRPGTAGWYKPEIRYLDAFLAEAARRHIRVLATVLDTPCWASSEPGKRCPPGRPHYHPSYPSRNPEDFADFFQRLIAHVGRRIQYYEIWNEPNLPRFWAHPDPVAYTRLLRAAYRAIKARDPAAQVLAGATAGADVGFVNRLYDAGAMGYFDALSVHPYSGGRPPDQCSAPSMSFGCGVEKIHQVMLRHGDRRPLWLTEFGVSVSWGVDTTAQASYVNQAFSLIRRWSYVQGAIWYELFDDPTGHDGEHFGLFDGTLTPRPAAAAFRSSVVSMVAGSDSRSTVRD